MDVEHDPKVVSVIVELVSASLKWANDLIQLFELEARLAFKTLVIILILMFALSTMLTALWISLLALLFFYLLSIHFSFFGATSIIILINVAAIFIVSLIIYRMKEHLFFSHTRTQINNLEINHEQLTTTEN